MPSFRDSGPARTIAVRAGFSRFWIALASAFLLALAAATAAHARGAPESFADLAAELLPAVVNVSTSQQLKQEDLTQEELEEFFKDFFEREGPGQSEAPRATSLGSGFIIDPSGYIVTNNHVIEGADQITVRLHDDRELEATLVGVDEKTDLALLKVESDEPLPSVAWGDSDATRIGDWVLAIGNPFGLGGSVTAGIVSARARDINAGPYDDFIQTDASINRGNSGGPMFNMDGQVVGIATAIFSPSGGSVGIGFAIPSNLARNVVEQLKDFGHARRGWLGVRIQTVTEELAEGLRLPDVSGALISAVTPDGPADRAGIKQGDVVLEFDGKKIEEMRQLPRIVAETAIGREVEAVVWRQGERVTLSVAVGELSEEAEQASLATPAPDSNESATKAGPIELLGLTVAPIDEALQQQYEIDPELSGVVIVDVDSKGAAAEKGLRVGDVIVEVDQKPVASPDEVATRVDEAKSNDYRVVTLLIYRGGDYQWIAVRIDRS